MREINAKLIENTICDLFKLATTKLPEDIYNSIKMASIVENDKRAADVLCNLYKNADAAVATGVPICQDTGMAFVFAEIGQDIHINGDFNDAVNRGVEKAYVDGKLRLSVAHPLTRKNTNNNTPAIIYTRLVPGDKIKLIAMPKGFGSENMSRIKMFNPTATKQDIIDFVRDTVKSAGANPCPPIVVGVGIGGSFDYCAYLSKKALTHTVGEFSEECGEIEKEILNAINSLNIGPQGFGGKTTCLWVGVEWAHTHIAGLPVAVNISCHATRHAEAVL